MGEDCDEAEASKSLDKVFHNFGIEVAPRKSLAD
jgi:hypothetical protein